MDEDLLEALPPLDAGDKGNSQSDKGSDSSQEESDPTSDTRSSSDRDRMDSDAGGEADKEQSHQDHDYKHDYDRRSRFFDPGNRKSNNNANQKRATGRDPNPPNNQNERGKFKSSSLKDPPNQAQVPDSQDYGDGIGHKHVDGRGSKKRKIS